MRILFIVSLFVAQLHYLNAQITITNNDMPRAGDRILLTTTNNADDYDFTFHGDDVTWDFSGLTASGDDEKRFLSVFQTGFIYGAYFSDIPFNPNRANVAQEGGL